VIVFHKLTKEEILTIVDIQMKRVREQMATHEVAIELTDEAKELLVEKGYDPAMGARPLRRAIQRVIEDPLADFVLGRSLEPGSTILVARKGDTEEVDMTVIPARSRPRRSPSRRSSPPTRRTKSSSPLNRRMRRLGGSAANEQLTAIVAAVLVPLLLAEGATLLNVGAMLTVHAFIGMLLVPVVVVKLASAGGA
jgi:hypothetical protein